MSEEKWTMFVFLRDGLPVQSFSIPNSELDEETVAALYQAARKSGLVTHELEDPQFESPEDAIASLAKLWMPWTILDQSMKEGLKRGDLSVIFAPPPTDRRRIGLGLSFALQAIKDGRPVVLSTQEIDIGQRIHEMRQRLMDGGDMTSKEIDDAISSMSPKTLGTVTGRLSFGEPNPPYHIQKSGPLVRQLKEDLTPPERKAPITPVDYSELELRVLAQKYTMYGPISGRLSCKEPNLSNIPRSMEEGAKRNGEVELKSYDHCNLIGIDSHRPLSRSESGADGMDMFCKCDGGSAECGPDCCTHPDHRKNLCTMCRGWDHFEEPFEIQKDDSSSRFKSDDEAVEAHKKECGCGWPEIDYQDALLSWQRTAEGCSEATDKNLEALLELAAALDSRGQEFYDDVKNGHIIAAITKTIDLVDSNNIKTSLAGMMKTAKTCTDKVRSGELLVKDFGYAEDWVRCERCRKPFIPDEEGGTTHRSCTGT